jgi:hypothetical protein
MDANKIIDEYSNRLAVAQKENIFMKVRMEELEQALHEAQSKIQSLQGAPTQNYDAPNQEPSMDGDQTGGNQP